MSIGLKIGCFQRIGQLLEIGGVEYPISCIRWRRHLKGLSRERGWAKSAENLGASPFKIPFSAKYISLDSSFKH
jgi:hypothetical protein